MISYLIVPIHTLDYELQDTAGSFHHRFSCTEHGFHYGCPQEGSLLHLSDWISGWSWKWELKDVRENIHCDCFHKVETSISRLHYQKEILDLRCRPET